MFDRLIISLNRIRRLFSRPKAKPEEILILLPHCIQRHDCDQDVVEDIGNCLRCGKCKMAEFARLRDEYRLNVHVVSGGQEALSVVRDNNVKIIIAVACEKELAAGILSLPTRKIYAIPNIIRTTPCKNTDVDMREVEEILKKVINHG